MSKVNLKFLSLLALLAAGLLCGTVSADITSADNLTVNEGFVNPIGFYAGDPDFSWILPQGGSVKSQSAYQIVAASSPKLLGEKADLWDSGKVSSSQSIHVKYQGKPLSSRQKVYWQLRYWDQQGRKSKWSKAASFELGLMDNSDWQGNWVYMKAKDAGQKAASPQIKVLKAAYGVPGDATRQIDLKAKVQANVDGGKYTVNVTNGFAGNDPAYNTKKIMLLEYILNGEKVTKELQENASYNLVTMKSGGQSADYVPEYLRKEFNVGLPVSSARLYITAKGLYEVYLNGERIGTDYMTPGWTPYDKRIETVTYDVSKQVKKQDNVIAAILGEGWYAGELMGKRDKYPELQPMLLVQLEITLKDGTVKTIVTDSSWKATDKGPIRYSGIYHGEIYEASKEMPGWNDTGFDDNSWNAVVTMPVTSEASLVPKRQNPVRATQKLKAQTITEPTAGKYVFDLGQNMVGWPELKVPVKAGQKITVRFAEMLEKDGNLYTDNYRGARSTDYYTAAKDGVARWHPTFTFHGYRYVELSGFSEGVKPKKDWVTGVVLHSDFKQTGKFESSHDKLNQLQSNITWGQRGNYLEVPTDCPQRNERLGWTGDAQVFCPTSLFNYDVHSFWASWLHSMRQDQRADGLIPNVVPYISCGYGSPGWGDVSVVSPWDIYVRTGDIDILKDNYEMMKGWTGAYEREAKDYIVDRKGYGDWLQPYPEGSGNKADTGMDIIATAYFGRCTGIMSKTASILGKDDEARKYSEQFKSIRKAFSNKFFDQSGKLTVKVPTQTAYLLALGYDLLEPQLRDGAVQNLLKLIEQSGGHLRTGFLGTPLINLVLDEFGHSDIAYQVLFKETYPSWFYSINQGATTMWERWNSYSHKDGFGDAGMNSFNHYAYGAIDQFMVERIAGLAPDSQQPGYKHFYIQPTPGEPLTWARATYQSPYGEAVSGWKITSKGLKIEVVVPTNTTATLVVPAEAGDNPILKESGRKCSLVQENGRYVYILAPGKYDFMLEM